jgi:hypothetical protein
MRESPRAGSAKTDNVLEESKGMLEHYAFAESERRELRPLHFPLLTWGIESVVGVNEPQL